MGTVFFKNRDGIFIGVKNDKGRGEENRQDFDGRFYDVDPDVSREPAERAGAYAPRRSGNRAFRAFCAAPCFERRVFQGVFQGELQRATDRARGDKHGSARGDAFDGGKLADDFRACL